MSGADAGTTTRWRTAAQGLVRWSGAVERALAALLMIMLLVLMLIQVGQRFMPGAGWVWAGELARYGLVWITFAVAGWLLARDEHVSLDLVDHVVPEGALRAIRVVGQAVVVAIAVAFVAEGWALVGAETQQRTPAMGIPMPVIYVIPLAGFVLVAVHGVIRIVATVTGAHELDPEPSSWDDDVAAGA